MTIRPMVTARSVYDGHVAQLAQAVTADFMAHGHFAAHLRLMRQLYRSRRDLLAFQRWVVTGLYRIVPWDEFRHDAKSAESALAPDHPPPC